MQTKVLTTPVDDIMNFIQDQKSTTITVIENKFKIPKELLEKWIVILEEFDLIEIHYKGLEGHVLYKDKETDIEEVLEQIKPLFVEKCKERNIELDKIRNFWSLFLQEFEPELKKLFYQNALKKGYNMKKTEFAWNRYRRSLQSL